jgi:hypothetical protein
MKTTTPPPAPLTPLATANLEHVSGGNGHHKHKKQSHGHGAQAGGVHINVSTHR